MITIIRLLRVADHPHSFHSIQLTCRLQTCNIAWAQLSLMSFPDPSICDHLGFCRTDYLSLSGHRLERQFKHFFRRQFLFRCTIFYEYLTVKWLIGLQVCEFDVLNRYAESLSLCYHKDEAYRYTLNCLSTMDFVALHDVQVSSGSVSCFISVLSTYDFMARTYLAVIMLAPSGSPVLRTALNVPQLTRPRISLCLSFIICELFALGSFCSRISVNQQREGPRYLQRERCVCSRYPVDIVYMGD